MDFYTQSAIMVKSEQSAFIRTQYTMTREHDQVLMECLSDYFYSHRTLKEIFNSCTLNCHIEQSSHIFLELFVTIRGVCQQDIRNQRRYRNNRKQELLRVRNTLNSLNEKRTFYESQIDYYNQYVKTCLDNLQHKSKSVWSSLCPSLSLPLSVSPCLFLSLFSLSLSPSLSLSLSLCFSHTMLFLLISSLARTSGWIGFD